MSFQFPGTIGTLLVRGVTEWEANPAPSCPETRYEYPPCECGKDGRPSLRFVFAQGPDDPWSFIAGFDERCRGCGKVSRFLMLDVDADPEPVGSFVEGWSSPIPIPRGR